MIKWKTLQPNPTVYSDEWEVAYMLYPVGYQNKQPAPTYYFQTPWDPFYPSVINNAQIMLEFQQPKQMLISNADLSEWLLVPYSSKKTISPL